MSKTSRDTSAQVAAEMTYYRNDSKISWWTGKISSKSSKIEEDSSLVLGHFLYWLWRELNTTARFAKIFLGDLIPRPPSIRIIFLIGLLFFALVVSFVKLFHPWSCSSRGQLDPALSFPFLFFSPVTFNRKPYSFN